MCFFYARRHRRRGPSKSHGKEMTLQFEAGVGGNGRWAFENGQTKRCRSAATVDLQTTTTRVLQSHHHSHPLYYKTLFFYRPFFLLLHALQPCYVYFRSHISVLSLVPDQSPRSRIVLCSPCYFSNPYIDTCMHNSHTQCTSLPNPTTTRNSVSPFSSAPLHARNHTQLFQPNLPAAPPSYLLHLALV